MNCIILLTADADIHIGTTQPTFDFLVFANVSDAFNASDSKYD